MDRLSHRLATHAQEVLDELLGAPAGDVLLGRLRLRPAHPEALHGCSAAGAALPRDRGTSGAAALFENEPVEKKVAISTRIPVFGGRISSHD